MNKTSQKTRNLVLTALFAAIILAMAFGGIGYIPLGFMNATIIHIPVILGALFLGPKVGAALGGIFGLTSIINNTIKPNLTSFVFSPFYSVGGVSGDWKSVVISMVPRILVGVVSYYVFRLVLKAFKGKKGGRIVAFACAGVSGALTNTLLVMNGIYFLFGNNYAAAKGIGIDSLYGLILTVIGTQGVPEAIVAGVLVTAVGQALAVIMKSSLPESLKLKVAKTAN